jgi:hypothetical protein
LLREIRAYAGADDVTEENQPGGGRLFVTRRECSFFALHLLFGDRAARAHAASGTVSAFLV